MAGLSLRKKQTGRKQPTIAVKVAVVGGPVKTIALHPSATMRDLVTHLTELELYGYGFKLMRGGKALKAEDRLNDGDTIIVAPTIYGCCTKIVRFGFTTPWPSMPDIETLLIGYLGAASFIKYDEGERRWNCQLPGDQGRQFHVFWEESQIRTCPHAPHGSDDLTKAVADGFAALCERKWNKELVKFTEDD